jgi:hypothetical protein
MTLYFVLHALTYLHAQDSYKKEVTWMGLDFTEAKLLTSVDFTDPAAIKNNLLVSWNDIIIKESSKFNVAGFFEIESLSYDLETVKERNQSIDPKNLVVDKTTEEFNEQKVESIISQYPKSTGVGLVFIVECFNKPSANGIFWATFFDRETLKILSVKKLQGQPSGVGIRNFWANSIFKAMKSNESKK